MGRLQPGSTPLSNAARFSNPSRKQHMERDLALPTTAAICRMTGQPEVIPTQKSLLGSDRDAVTSTLTFECSLVMGNRELAHCPELLRD